MKRIPSGGIHTRLHRVFATAVTLVICCAARWAALADQVQMRNGDQYFGNVVSLNKDTLVIQSDVLGTIRLPRGKVALVDFGVGPIPQQSTTVLPPTNSLRYSPALVNTNSTGDLSATLQQLGGSSNVLHQIEAQYLGDAGPEAKAKFNELLGGFLGGKLSVDDIRAQAQTTADQVRGVRKDLGEDAGALIDGYLAILDTFLKETAPPPTSPAITPPARPPTPKASLQQDE